MSVGTLDKYGLAVDEELRATYLYLAEAHLQRNGLIDGHTVDTAGAVLGGEEAYDVHREVVEVWCLSRPSLHVGDVEDRLHHATSVG